MFKFAVLLVVVLDQIHGILSMITDNIALIRNSNYLLQEHSLIRRSDSLHISKNRGPGFSAILKEIVDDPLPTTKVGRGSSIIELRFEHPLRFARILRDLQ